MKKLLTISLFTLSSSLFTLCNAQFVTIPDANFVTYLNTVVPSAMSGNQMDTTNTSVLTLTSINVENLGILNISGVQYFKALQTLDCGNGSPSVDSNHLTKLPPLPATLQTLICGNNQIDSLPALPGGLQTLKCYINKLDSLPAVPSTLTYLDCSSNILKALPTLSGGTLSYLECSTNKLTSLPTLPGTLTYLDCDQNSLSTLPALPSGITLLDCGHNAPLTSIPALPAALLHLFTWGDPLLTALPALPNLVQNISTAGDVNLSSFPALPATLTNLQVDNNDLSTLPALPAGLQGLLCGGNHLTSLPPLPAGMLWLECSGNQITHIDTLPAGLVQFQCNSNLISCFPPIPSTLTTPSLFNISSNPFSCLPNYVLAMDPGTLAYPLCLPGNSHGCPDAEGIVGYIYTDSVSHCKRDTGYRNLVNVPVQLFNKLGDTLWSQTYSAVNGIYDFSTSSFGNSFQVIIDTTGMMPYVAQCVHPGLDSLVTLTTLDTNVNFALTCPSGFDVGVQSVVTKGLVFPNLVDTVSVVAGDLSQWYNLNCAAGDSGTVQISVSGPATYLRPCAGALTPNVVSGNNFTYHIADFGAINNTSAFNLIFKTDTLAHAGDTICVNVEVTPYADNHPANNSWHYCYTVVNSHDPNTKVTYPTNVSAGYDDWFTYTINFQNTGNSPAKNILLSDTLSNDLELRTFQLINYSYPNTTVLKGHMLTVRFDNINLPDTAMSKTGSTGFVQYRIKPKPGLPAGTIIKNTGYIYFDFNSAIITDTTLNTFSSVVITSGNTIKANGTASLFPNPNTGTFTITLQHTDSKCSVLIYNELGQQVYTTPLNIGNTLVRLSDKAPGIYFYRIIAESGKLVSDGKMVVQ